MQTVRVHMWMTIDTSNSQILVVGVQYKGPVAFLWSLFLSYDRCFAFSDSLLLDNLGD